MKKEKNKTKNSALSINKCANSRLKRFLTCYLFPQLGQLSKSDKGNNSNYFHSRIMDF